MKSSGSYFLDSSGNYYRNSSGNYSKDSSANYCRSYPCSYPRISSGNYYRNASGNYSRNSWSNTHVYTEVISTGIPGVICSEISIKNFKFIFFLKIVKEIFLDISGRISTTIPIVLLYIFLFIFGGISFGKFPAQS